MTDCQCAELPWAGSDTITVACWNCGRTLTISPDTPVLDEILIHPDRHFFDAIRYRGHREGPSEYHRTIFVQLFAPEQSFFWDYA